MARCPECFFEPYTGQPHLYGGRASAGMMCFGPRTYRATARKPVVEPAKLTSSDQREEHEREQVEHRDPTPKKEKKPTRAERVASQFAALGLKLGSEIASPDPASRPTKRSRRGTDPRQTLPHGTPSAADTDRTESNPAGRTDSTAATHDGDRTPDSDTRKTRVPAANHQHRESSAGSFREGTRKANYRRPAKRTQR